MNRNFTNKLCSVALVVFLTVLANEKSFSQRILFSGFEDATEPLPPPGWVVTNTGNANWESLYAIGGYGNQYAGKYCMYLANSFYGDRSDAWLISPSFTLEAGKKYSISFYYKNQINAANGLEVTLGDDTIPASQTEVIWSRSFKANYYQKAQINYTATQTRTLHLGIHCITEKTFTYAYIDDVTVQTVNCFEPLSPTALQVSTSGAYIKWNTVADAAYYEYGISDSANGPKQVKRTDKNTVRLSTLESAKHYYFYVRSRCSETDASNWAVSEFSTAYSTEGIQTLDCGVKFSNNNFLATQGLYTTTLYCNAIYFGREFFHKFVPAVAGTYTLHISGVNVGQTEGFLYKDAALGAGPEGWTCIGSANDFGGKATFGPLEAGKEYLIMEKSFSAPGWPSSYSYKIDCLEPLVATSSDESNATVSASGKISVSPNPFTSNFFINTNEAKACKYNIIISTTDGRVVSSFTKNVNAGSSRIAIDASNMQAGIYVVKIETPSGIQFQKIVKQ